VADNAVSDNSPFSFFHYETPKKTLPYQNSGTPQPHPVKMKAELQKYFM